MININILYLSIHDKRVGKAQILLRQDREALTNKMLELLMGGGIFPRLAHFDVALHSQPFL